MKARSLLLIFLLFLLATAASAGDICSFVNLGFSPDSRNFMFGIYGVKGKDSIPYAEAFLVDVQTNRFLPGGQLTVTSKKPASLGQDGSGALYNILHTIKPQIDRYRIDHLELGRMIYILVNGQEAKSSINFRDYNTDRTYDITLNQKSKAIGGKNGQPDTTAAEFSINLQITDKDGKTFSAIVGKPGYYREAVDMYQLRQVILSPDEMSLLFVIEEQVRINGSLDTSYMVETVSLK